VYAASKWAVRAWAESSDRYLRDQGVRVRSICPGRTESALLDSALATFSKAAALTRDAYEARCLALIPAGTFGSPEAILPPSDTW
jgi:NAD(P)-dependent dehydrogenase (short-subunit alcohol dehydrogenase family)